MRLQERYSTFEGLPSRDRETTQVTQEQAKVSPRTRAILQGQLQPGETRPFHLSFVESTVLPRIGRMERLSHDRRIPVGT